MSRKKKYNYIKVLPLQKWMLYEDEYEDLPSIPSITGVPGWYFNKAINMCWFELPNNKAYMMKTSTDFKFNLKIISANEYPNDIIKPLKYLNTLGLLTDKQKELLYYKETALDINRIRKGRT